MSMARSSKPFCRKSIRASAAMTSSARSMSAPSKAVVAFWIASVTSSVELTELQRSRLQTSLNKLYGRQLKLNSTIDPSIVGGLVVKVGDEVVDASVASRVAELRRTLVG